MIEKFYRADDLGQRIQYEVKNKISNMGSNVPMPDEQKWIEWISDIVYCILSEYHNTVLSSQFNSVNLEDNWQFRMTKEKAELAASKIEALGNMVLELQGKMERLLSQMHGPDYGQRGRIQDVALNAIRTGE